MGRWVRYKSEIWVGKFKLKHKKEAEILQKIVFSWQNEFEEENQHVINEEHDYRSRTSDTEKDIRGDLWLIFWKSIAVWQFPAS